MKTKLLGISKRTLAMILALLMMISILGLGSLITSNAWAINGGKVYFIKPSTWTSGVQLLYSLNDGTSTRTKTFTQLSGSLYYCDYGSSAFESKDLAYIDASGWGNEDNTSVEARKGYADHRSWTKTSAWNWYNSGTYYLVTMNSGDADSDFSQSYNSNRDNLMMKKQTASVYTNKASSSTGGSVSLAGYYFTADNAVASSSSSSEYNAIIGTTMTMTATANSGYTFDGWYSDSSCSTKLSSDASYSYTVSAAKTVYANFKPKTYTVTYNKGSNGTGTNTTDTKTHGTALTLKGAIFNRTGYTQDGWSTTDGGSKTYNLSASYTANAAVTLYPYWKADTYTVTYNKGSNGTGTNTTDTKTYGTALTLKGAIFTRTGYTQTAWNTNSSGTGGTSYALSGNYTANAAVTLYPTWTANTYNISYTGSNVSYTTKPTSATYGSTVNFSISAVNPYVLNEVTGTYTDGSGSHSLTISGSNGSYSFTQPAGDVAITITTVKTPRTVTVTKGTGVESYVVNGSTYSADHAFTVSDGDSFTITSVTYSTGYENNNNTLSIASVTSNQTIALTGKKTSYTITKATATNGSFTVSKTTANYGDTITITPTANTNYTVDTVKYNDGSDHTITYNSGYTFTMPAHNVTVTVTFKEATYTVTVQSESTTKGTVANSSVTAGNVTWVTLPTATAEAGYTFSTWEITSGTGTLNNATSATSGAIKASGACTVTARFTETMNAITVQPEYCGVEPLGTVSPVSGSAGVATSLSVSATARTGYAFMNWTGENLTFANASNSSTSLTASAAGTATANYKPTKLYLDISGNTSWRNQTIKIYFWNGSNSESVDMNAVAGETDLYVGDIPEGFYENTSGNWGFIFYYGNWTKQTGDLQFDGKKNRYAVTSTLISGETKKYTGSWDADAFILETKYDVTVNSGSGGTVTFNTTTEVAANSYETVSVGATARSLVAAPQAGYHFVSWSTTGGASVASTTSASTTITATAAGTVTATFAQDVYTVSLSGSNCTLNTYSDSGMTTTKTQFNYGNTVYYKLTPASGYRITSIKIGDGTTTNYTDPADTNYKSGNFTITGNTTITVTTVQVYTVTLSRMLNSDASNTPFTSTQYKLGSSGTYTDYSSALTVDAGTVVYFKVAYRAGYEYNSISNATFDTNYTVFKTSAISANTTVIISAKKTNYNVNSTISSGSVSGNSIQFKKSTASTYSNTLTDANVGDTINIKVTTAANYYLTSFTASEGTAPSIPSGGGNGSNYTMNYTMTASSVTFTAAFSQEATVTFNIDMHGNTVNASNALEVRITGGTGQSTAVTDHTGASCSITFAGGTLTKQSTSTVYSGNVTVPLTADTIYFVVKYKGNNYYNNLTKTQISGGTVWLEAANDASVELSKTYLTNSTKAVASGYKRIYIKKPYSWQNTTDGQKFTNMGLYHWGDYTDIGWTNSVAITYAGYDNTGSSGYHYYYADIPKEAKYVIVQGWGSNTSLGGDNPASKIAAKTEDIELTSTNYIALSQSGSSFIGTMQTTAAKTPDYTRYVSAVTMNKSESGVSIAPTNTAQTVTYVTSNSSVVTVNSSGVLTGVARGTATITVRVCGTAGGGAAPHPATGAPDTRTYTCSVTIKDPSVLSGFNIMSLATRTSTITIPQVSSTQPGYFDSITTKVEGLANGGTSTAIVTSTNGSWSNGDVNSGIITYTVKYAAPNSTFTYTGGNYGSIDATATVVSKSIKYSDSNRYGYKKWQDDGVDCALTATKSVENGKETATTKNIVLDGSTFSEIFEQYAYVDVTFNYDYYEYETERTVQKLDAEGNPIPILDQYDNPTGEYETEQKNFYFYDPEWVGEEDRTEEAFDATKHKLKTFTVTDYEVRLSSGQNSSNVSESNIYDDALEALNMPENNYYDYTINASTIKNVTTNGTYKATVKVEMTHSPKKYKVYRNGIAQTNSNDGSPNRTTENFYYQEYANLTNGTSLNWILTDENRTYTGPTMYTGKAYKFRVTGDTYLKTTAGSISDSEFNRSRVTLTNQEITYEDKTVNNVTKKVEKLTNDFYIADFFDPAKVLNDRNLPEDDVKFVGGGVVYYQVKDGAQVDGNGNPIPGTPAQKPVNGGYVDAGTGLADEDAVKEFIQEKIEAGLNDFSIVPNDIEGEDDRMAIAYGTEIKAKKDNDTDLYYRYLPYETYKRINGALETQTVDGVTSYTFNTDKQSNTYRYSNALKAYQYIYASKQENKLTNEGKDMRLYAYYIYSYTAYDEDTGVPYTTYKVVLSDKPANATTYFQNSNNNS